MTAARRAFTFLTALLFVVSGSNLRAENEQARFQREQARLQREAKSLFRTIIASKKLPPQPCEFDVSWFQSAIPEWSARAELGLNIRASLSAPDHQTEPHDILDPDRKTASAFCSKEEAQANQAEQVKNLEDGKVDRVQIVRTLCTFPVFDAAYQKALIVVVHQELDKRPPGVKADLPEAIVFVAVYVKVKGAWRFLKRITLGQT